MNKESPLDEQDQMAVIRQDIEALKQEVVGLEHRLVQVIRNAYWALINRDGWTRSRRLEAGAALIRYFFAGRATVVIGIGLGGLLALHASFMLADQNRKLDLQNHLSVVASEIAEAQRNSQFAQLIPPLIADISQAKALSKSDDQVSKKDTRDTTRLPDDLALRIAVLTQTFQPYRWVDKSTDGSKLISPIGDGTLFSIVQSVRRLYVSAFGSSALEAGGQGHLSIQLPILTAERYSPERGMILINLYALRMNLETLTRFNATFERSFAPGARLDGIDMRGLYGPDLSKPINLAYSYFPRATLNRAFVGSVNFSGANLQFAELNSIHAADTQWIGADLSNSQLISADLSRAVMDRAVMTGAILDLANLSETNLETVVGLTQDQLLKACINRQTTVLPLSMLPQTYEIPTACCEHWSNTPSGFRKDENGRCLPN